MRLSLASPSSLWRLARLRRPKCSASGFRKRILWPTGQKKTWSHLQTEDRSGKFVSTLVPVRMCSASWLLSVRLRRTAQRKVCLYDVWSFDISGLLPPHRPPQLHSLRAHQFALFLLTSICNSLTTCSSLPRSLFASTLRTLISARSCINPRITAHLRSWTLDLALFRTLASPLGFDLVLDSSTGVAIIPIVAW